ncbi:MAG: hypothetical protein IID44_14810 [Planctomycetes bacterium]|nr:hypothetical protein [Planctomycetota bacterium]
MLFEVFRREDVLAIGRYFRLLWVGLIEGVNDERAVHFDRLFFSASAIKEQASAEAAHRRLTGLVQDGFAPYRHNLGRRSRVVGHLVAPGNFAAQVELRAAGGETHDGQQQATHSATS